MSRLNLKGVEEEGEKGAWASFSGDPAWIRLALLGFVHLDRLESPPALHPRQSSSSKGFRKVNPDQWEFANEAFLAGQKHLLKEIRRRRPSKDQMESQLRNGSSVCHGQPESLNEVDSLKRDGAALRAEVTTLKRQYNICKSYLISMEQRVLNNERKQQKIITFFAKALSNPVFAQHILLYCADKKEPRNTAKRQKLVENEEQQVVNALLKKSTTAGSSDCSTAAYNQSLPKGGD